MIEPVYVPYEQYRAEKTRCGLDSRIYGIYILGGNNDSSYLWSIQLCSVPAEKKLGLIVCKPQRSSRHVRSVLLSSAASVISAMESIDGSTKRFQTTFVRNYILPCLYCARTTLHVSATHEPSSGVSRIMKC
jgi:hypothetical protein